MASVTVHVDTQVLQQDYWALLRPTSNNNNHHDSKSPPEPNEPCLIGSIHQGTAHTRFLLITSRGRVAASAITELDQVYFPSSSSSRDDQTQQETRQGWHEQDALEIVYSVQAVIQELGMVLRHKHGLDLRTRPLRALGITHQRETTIAWNHETGIPYYNAIVWDDTRTQPIAHAMAQGNPDCLRHRTGLPCAAYFVGTKVKWLLDHVPALQDDLQNPQRRSQVRFGTVDTWLIYQLTGRPVPHHAQDVAIACQGQFLTDVTNASRWLFLDLTSNTHQWDPDLVHHVCAPHVLPLETCLPQICPNVHQFGTVGGDHSHEEPGKRNPSAHQDNNHESDRESHHDDNDDDDGFAFVRGVPIASVMGDQQAALFGHAAFDKGDAKNTYGSALFLMMNTGTEPLRSSRLLTTIAYQLGADQPVHYALEGGVSHCGSTIQWLKTQLQIIPSASDTEALATRRNDGLYFVPAFAGLFAPRWRPDARACLFGLTTSHHKGHLCRAALEAPAYQTREIFDAIVESSSSSGSNSQQGSKTNHQAMTTLQSSLDDDSPAGIQLQSLKVDGGGTANQLMMQFQADMVRVPVEKHVVKEVACLGVAFCAGLGTGVWHSLDEIKALWSNSKIYYHPQMSDQERDHNWNGWNKAVTKSLGWIDCSSSGLMEEPGADEDAAKEKETETVNGVMKTANKDSLFCVQAELVAPSIPEAYEHGDKDSSTTNNNPDTHTVDDKSILTDDTSSLLSWWFPASYRGQASLALCSATAFCVSVAVGAMFLPYRGRKL